MKVKSKQAVTIYAECTKAFVSTFTIIDDTLAKNYPSYENKFPLLCALCWHVVLMDNIFLINRP